MKKIVLIILILQSSFCLAQKVKRKIEFLSGSVSQYIHEYDTLGRVTKEILTSNEDTLKYQFEDSYFYDNESKLKLVVEKHSWGINYTVHYYDKQKYNYKSVTYNSNDKIISYKLYNQNETTEYKTYGEKKPSRVQTTVNDNLGNKIKFFGWEKTDKRKQKWDYKFINEYSEDNKLTKTKSYLIDDKLEETLTYEYNSYGLMTKILRTTEKYKSIVVKQYRYEYY